MNGGRVASALERTKKQLKHEITRENSLTQDQLDSWRKYICGKDPVELPAPPNLSGEAKLAPPSKAVKETLDYSPEGDLDKPRKSGSKKADPEDTSASRNKRRWN